MEDEVYCLLQRLLPVWQRIHETCADLIEGGLEPRVATGQHWFRPLGLLPLCATGRQRDRRASTRAQEETAHHDQHDPPLLDTAGAPPGEDLPGAALSLLRRRDEEV